MSTERTSCYMIGEGSLLIQCAEIYLEKGHEILGVVANDAGIRDWAQKKGLVLLRPGKHLLEQLSATPFDYLFSIANLRMISADILALPKKLAVNFHDGPLPRYAGVHATNWALLNREEEHGITWHEMLAEADKGRLILQKKFEISPHDTALSLNTKCFQAGIESFREMIEAIDNDALPLVEQDFSERSYFGLDDRPRGGAMIPWNQSAAEIDGLVRALEFGEGYENPVGLPKIAMGDRLAVLREIEVLEDRSEEAPGTILCACDKCVRVSTATQDVALVRVGSMEGEEWNFSTLVAELGLTKGQMLRVLDDATADRLDELNRCWARREKFWRGRLSKQSPLDLAYIDQSINDEPRAEQSRQTLDAEPTAIEVAFPLYLARLAQSGRFDLGYRSLELQQDVAVAEWMFSERVPMRVNVDLDQPKSVAEKALRSELVTLAEKGTFARDAWARDPRLTRAAVLPIALERVASLDGVVLPKGVDLLVSIGADGGVLWSFNAARIDAGAIAAMQEQFAFFLTQESTEGGPSLGATPILSEAQLRTMMEEWNDTSVELPRDELVHTLFEKQVAHTPHATALIADGESLTYAELNARANQLARHLVDLGVGPDRLVGVMTERDADLVISIMAVLKAGGAYVPLDPTYPADRLRFMVEDAQIAALITQEKVANILDDFTGPVIRTDTGRADYSNLDDSNLERRSEPNHLAYVIYTSGSTGKPKGVMVEHRNAVNFFVGMDERIPHAPRDTWLAVTSLSFDISVLELFWTLARGLRVVLYRGDDRTTQNAPTLKNGAQSIDFSLFYFSSDEAQGGDNKYRLLLDGARFADANGFSAVWTPERHFHAFGGLYPNPAVTGAAVAAITENVQIRAGSCVIPLHSPVRVAEEWSVVDNISGGRVGVSMAAGWQPNDFVLAPDNFADRKDLMMRSIDDVQKLWRGESISLKDGTGNEIDVSIMPRPVQDKLPVWLTAAGNPETFRMAGEHGANLLTHLLGQTLEELKEKIAVYRQAWKDAGHPGEGTVSLMLHTYVGRDTDEVRELVREPMKEYLRSAVGLVQKAAWSFPTFKESTIDKDGRFTMDNLSPEEVDAVLDYSFERYFETSGLFGSLDRCVELVDQLKGLGVDDVACLIDFGVPHDLVLDQLPLLATVRERSNKSGEGLAVAGSTIPQLIEEYAVTHFQCTPSMASMLVATDEDRAALAKVQHVMVGGEAMPPALAAQLHATVPGTVTNMYGPTETTIWSSTFALEGNEVTIPIGTPIANTQIYILDENLNPVPPGVAG